VFVVDASVALATSASEGGVKHLSQELIAPSLMWSEATSALRELYWRGQIELDDAELTFARLQSAPIRRRDPKALRRTAWDIAEELGWAKTYDAEYLALARLTGTQVVTLDARLLRGAARLGVVVGLDEVLKR
jgi:predicted nucleic acid-binding protein